MVVSSIKDGVSSAVSGAKDAVSDVADAGTDAIGEGLSSVFDADVFDLGGLGDRIGGAVDLITGQRSLGSIADRALDSLGLPDWAGNLAGAAVDVMTKNPGGAIDRGLEIAGDVAEAANVDGASDFLDTAGDVMGMASDSVGAGDDFGALASETFASGGTEQFLADAVETAGPRALTDAVGVADTLSERVDGAAEAIHSFRNGEVASLGAEFVDAMDASTGALMDVTEGIVDSDVFEYTQEFIDGQRGFIVDQVVDDLDVDTPAPGSTIADSFFETGLADRIQSVLPPGTDVASDDVSSAVIEAGSTAAGYLDIAAHSPKVATEITEILDQIHGLSESDRVADLIAGPLRA